LETKRLIIRVDDISANTNGAELYEMYEVFKERYSPEFWFAISPMSKKLNPSVPGSIYPEPPFK
jgi:hypothetical protein|tara:strand:- start:3061 stop:3252 length:192 start_codon:yes stop_codon:yes gene_type:complete